MINIRKLAPEVPRKATSPSRVPYLRLQPPPRIATALLPVLVLSQRAHAQLVSTSEVSSGEFFVAFVCVMMAGIAVNALLVSLVRPRTERPNWQKNGSSRHRLSAAFPGALLLSGVCCRCSWNC